MGEKKQTIYNVCGFTGTMCFWVYIFMIIAGSNIFFFRMRVLFAGIAALAYIARIKIEINNERESGSSTFYLVIALIDILLAMGQM